MRLTPPVARRPVKQRPAAPQKNQSLSLSPTRVCSEQTKLEQNEQSVFVVFHMLRYTLRWTADNEPFDLMRHSEGQASVGETPPAGHVIPTRHWIG